MFLLPYNFIKVIFCTVPRYPSLVTEPINLNIQLRLKDIGVKTRPLTVQLVESKMPEQMDDDDDL